MAYYQSTADYLEELSCSICLELFKDPVIVECGHNFCKSCINKVWDSLSTLCCPECKEEFSDRRYTVNRFLANQVAKAQSLTHKLEEEIIEIGQEEEEQQTYVKHEEVARRCWKHEERLNLFCEEDEALACSLCVPKHYGHHFISLQEAVNIYQEKLKANSESLEASLKDLRELQEKQEKEVAGIKERAQNLEQHVTSEFAKLYRFIQDKEQQLIKQLKDEAAGILNCMEQNLKEIVDKINTIQEHIADLQSKMDQDEAVLFLTGIKEETERYLKIEEEQCGSQVALVIKDLRQGVYNDPQLLHNVWKKMKSVIGPTKEGEKQPVLKNNAEAEGESKKEEQEEEEGESTRKRRRRVTKKT
ncbi:nuclear factor 7, ovary-like [Protopterus annectens]|uniref:nuclear factor 7, ovary-like n=1 Tax=Protopterus annectens TaxID=7888 RepID=UPI001CFBA6EC|nr:nuclear factor 7, ovary-like [Protopterus annectens]